MPETTQYVPESKRQYGYEWMNALAQAGDLFSDLFEDFLPAFEAYGLIPGQEVPSSTQPQPEIVVQPAPEVITPKWYDQIPPWGWGLIGLGGGALVFALLRR